MFVNDPLALAMFALRLVTFPQAPKPHSKTRVDNNYVPVLCFANILSLPLHCLIPTAVTSLQEKTTPAHKTSDGRNTTFL